MNTPLIIIQARTNSSRLPNKVILPFYKNETILEIICNKFSKYLKTKIVIATSTNQNDDQIVKIANKLNINIYRGEENNVLNRFVNCAEQNNAKKIVRICSDNPFIDYDFTMQLIDKHIRTNSDYTSFITSTKTPSIKTHFGLFTEVVELNALKKIQLKTSEKIYQEHVTNYIYENPNQFNLNFINIPTEIETLKMRLTLDTIEDWNILSDLYTNCIEKNKNFTTSDLINFISKNISIQDKMQEQILKHLK